MIAFSSALLSGPDERQRREKRTVSTIQATSVFHAAEQGIQAWAKFWWFDTDALIAVQSDDERWSVQQKRVIASRRGRKPSA
jgi:hypothetical protein